MKIAQENIGKIVVMMGNEAIARGCIEAGVKVAAGYPGTPSTEIIESLASCAAKFGIHVEWSTNEMVAFEVAAGAAILGLRAMVSMKHVGLNWAADPFMVINHTGVEGGLVVVSADDPGGHSSQNEQDNRNYGKFAEILTLEPSCVSEAKEMAKQAFDLSEQVKLPVLLRTVTRISHARGIVTLGDIKKNSVKPRFKDDVSRWICRGIYTVPHHKLLHDKNKKIKELAETSPFNSLTLTNFPRLGVIASGIGYAYAKEAIKILNLDDEVDILKIGIPYPLPENQVKTILRRNEKILVIEEGSIFVEDQVRVISSNMNEKPKIYGRLTQNIPNEGEINADMVGKAIGDILGLNYKPNDLENLNVIAEAKEKIPRRPLTLCAGCPHRATLYALRRALKKMSMEDKVLIASDIGCYGSGSATPPFNIADTLLCMGGGIGVANGFSAARWEGPIIALIGDSTFLHAGIPALINAVYNKHKFLLLIMDNRTTAMTGMQDHPGTGVTATKFKSKEIKIEEVCRAIGVEYVAVIDPFNLKLAIDVFKEALHYNGVSVVIARRSCMLMRMREIHKKGIVLRPYYIVEEKCNGCKVCITEFACPAFRWVGGVAKISESDCVSCGFCRYICSKGAITIKKDEGS